MDTTTTKTIEWLTLTDAVTAAIEWGITTQDEQHTVCERKTVRDDSTAVSIVTGRTITVKGW